MADDRVSNVSCDQPQINIGMTIPLLVWWIHIYIYSCIHLTYKLLISLLNLLWMFSS